VIVVSDTTPLNYLILTATVHVLPAIFGRVYAPSAVLGELSHARSPEAVRAFAASPPEWLTVQDPLQVVPTLKLGGGETAAIALAEELRADWVLLDERKGSRVAQGRGLRVAGTLTILEEAGARGLLDYEETRDRLVNQTTFYATEEVLRESERRFQQRKQSQTPTREQPEPSRDQDCGQRNMS
jgi:predicted nucleic acid-binding protein